MLYQGEVIAEGSITLNAPNAQETIDAIAKSDLEPHQVAWFSRDRTDDGVLYFSIRLGSRLVGQILLHDIAPPEALVGYHIFSRDDRGHGYGTDALAAICSFGFRHFALERLVVITDVSNVASRRIAEKCGFSEIGLAREGEHLVVYERRAAADTKRP